MKTWEEIKDKVHDASGVDNPEEWLWELHGRQFACYYPVKKIEE